MLYKYNDGDVDRQEQNYSAYDYTRRGITDTGVAPDLFWGYSSIFCAAMYLGNSFL